MINFYLRLLYFLTFQKHLFIFEELIKLYQLYQEKILKFQIKIKYSVMINEQLNKTNVQMRKDLNHWQNNKS